MSMLLFLPLLIITLSIIRTVRYYRKLKSYYRVKGTVVRNSPREVKAAMNSYVTYYTPIFHFIDKDGIERTMEYSEDNPDRPLYKQGDTYTLLVSPADAHRFIVDDWFDGYVISAIWFVIGVGVLLLMIFYA
jgi:hypothetical protein